MKYKSISRYLDAAAAIAVIAAAVAVMSFAWRQNSGSSNRGAQARPQAVEDIALTESVDISVDLIKDGGNPSVALLEFSDIECPFCGRHARDVHPELERHYFDTDRVVHVFRHFPLESIHPRAVEAAAALLCAEESGKGHDMRRVLFGNQRSLAPDDLLKYASTLDLDGNDFAGCLAGDVASAVRQDLELGKRLGVTSTPTFFVGRIETGGRVKLLKKIRGAQPFESFREVLDAVLAKT